jgi:hypothetical protein
MVTLCEDCTSQRLQDQPLLPPFAFKSGVLLACLELRSLLHTTNPESELAIHGLESLYNPVNHFYSNRFFCLQRPCSPQIFEMTKDHPVRHAHIADGDSMSEKNKDSYDSPDGLEALQTHNGGNVNGGLDNNEKYELSENDCYDELGFSFPKWKKWTILVSIPRYM